jgi:hypothetical protein
MLGWGPETFRTGFARHVGASWVRRYSLDQLPDRAHNRFIDIAGTTGVFGLAADVALLLAVAIAVRRRLAPLEPRSAEWWTVAGVVAGLIAWLVQGQFLFDTFDVALVAWTLAGAVLATSRTARWDRAVLSGLAVALAAVVVFAGFNFVADRRVQSASGEAAPVAIDRLRAAAHMRPRALDTYLLAAEVAVRSGDRPTLVAAHALLRGWRDDAVRVADARVLILLGRATDATSMLAGVVHRQPNDPRAWTVLGDALRVQGRAGEASDAYRRAAELQPARRS